MTDPDEVVAQSQEALHGEGHDYTVGSPHLRHRALRDVLENKIDSAVSEVVRRTGGCRVLEIGAGHGSFTDVVVRAGGMVTVTEMSRPSTDLLTRRFAGADQVTILYDPDGREAFRQGGTYDLILLISVIHHIPDYLGLIEELIDTLLAEHGSVLTYQDPLWYPTQSRTAMATSWGSYFVWRLGQGEMRRGLKTRLRRLRGTYDDQEPSDLVEYHVIRDGVDQRALTRLFESRFESVSSEEYFSTQLPALQKVGSSLFPPNTFGISGRDARPADRR